MKLSCMLAPFHKPIMDGTLATGKILAGFRSEGITAIEPSMGWVESRRGKWEEFHRAARDAGMVYSCYDVNADLIGESEADRSKALDSVARGVAFCKSKLNCSIVMLVGSRPATGMSNEDGRKIYAEQLAKACERTKGSGVTLTIEDYGMHPMFTASAAHCIEVLKATRRPEIKFTFDNGNFLLAEDKPTQVYRLLRDWIVHVHIKDFALRPPDSQKSLTSTAGKQYKDCLIGQGEAEVSGCVKLLKADKYSGWLSIEVGVGADPLGEAIHVAKYIAKAWQA